MEELKETVRDAVMDTFRSWGGQWNVTALPPEAEDSPDRWQLRVHSRPVIRATVSTSALAAYIENPTDPEAVTAWETELRPIFEDAKAQAP